eukprot:CAMPEP_0177289796 /NCGR_PEP_ID=MMETSP0367-20130122/75404_1 /TAXON_ID=447022 ORGANISM="Scrippsiella hangoei-like, Strain SHHI-4" /NCGR_SAMPLE_ID=MMETSP0367 /ASSEMBLY_ACC=CAM_ASM_000362 /LENGTH=198 /DNA_ID=CAMNT_0018747247 /DNA_START=741 /DNA_END=1333 /DNA_ORIENTATION=+
MTNLKASSSVANSCTFAHVSSSPAGTAAGTAAPGAGAAAAHGSRGQRRSEAGGLGLCQRVGGLALFHPNKLLGWRQACSVTQPILQLLAVLLLGQVLLLLLNGRCHEVVAACQVRHPICGEDLLDMLPDIARLALATVPSSNFVSLGIGHPDLGHDLEEVATLQRLHLPEARARPRAALPDAAGEALLAAGRVQLRAA